MRIAVLDSLRGLFALAIVLLHGPFQANLHYNTFIRNSGVFVDFFFVLSGFVIALAYRDRVRDERSFAGFLIRRTGRLWPLHFFVLVLFMLVLAAKLVAEQLGLFSADLAYTIPQIQKYALENAFLVQSFRNETVYWLNFPSWSISVELWVYLVFALLCLIPRLLPFAAVAVMVFAMAVIFKFVDPGFGHFFGDGLYRGLCFFFLGYLTCLLWRRVRRYTLPVPLVLELALVALVVWQVGRSDSAPTDLLLPVIFAATILVFSYEAGPVSHLLKTAPFMKLGALSYSIYMIHILVYSLLSLGVRMAERLLDRSFHSADLANKAASPLLDFGSPLLNDVVMVATAGLVVLCASLTYRFIELPGQRIARGMARSVEARPVTGH